MATLTQYLGIRDGVTGPLRKMAAAANALMQRQNAAAEAIGRTERAADSMGSSAGRARGAMSVMANGLSAIAGAASGAEEKLNRLRERMEQPPGKSGGGFFSSMAGQFAIGNILADTAMRAMSAGMEKISGVVSRADAFSGMKARLEDIAGGQAEAVELNNQIYASALRARGSYVTLAESVSKIGLAAREAFPDAKEIVPFVENVQKLFAIGGTGAEEQRSAMLQLTQALGSGRLQGDELRSISEAAPMLNQMIAKYMGVSVGQIKEMGAKGQITAGIIKNAMLSATDEINEKFEKIPRKWQDVWTEAATRAERALQAVYTKITELADSDAARGFVSVAAAAVEVLGAAVLGVFNIAARLYDVFAEYGNFITPVILTLAAAFAASKVHILESAAAFALNTAATVAHTAASAAETAAIIALEIAQNGLNAALAACPLTWILYGIIALVGVFYLAVAAVNRFAGTSISATGLIAAGFMNLYVSMRNTIAWAWNMVLSFAEFLLNVFVDPLTATRNLFANIWNGIVDLVGSSVKGILDMIAKIPGISKVIDVSGINIDDYKIGVKPVVNGADLSKYRMQTLDYGKEAGRAYNAAANWSFKDMLPKLPGTEQMPHVDMPEIPELGAGSGLAGVRDGIDKVADNTKAIKESMDIVDEDLKFYRDMAEQEAINRYTTAKVDIKVENQNNIASDVDAEGMVTRLITQLGEAMNAGGEAVRE